jgi:hypothetical protein
MTTRTTLNRPRRSGSFDREVLELFARLEAVPRRLRSTDEYKADRKRLGIMLDLGPLAFWMSVNEDEPEPEHDSRGGLDYQDWRVVRDKREQLLAAAHKAGLIKPRHRAEHESKCPEAQSEAQSEPAPPGSP